MTEALTAHCSEGSRTGIPIWELVRNAESEALPSLLKKKLHFNKIPS